MKNTTTTTSDLKTYVYVGEELRGIATKIGRTQWALTKTDGTTEYAFDIDTAIAKIAGS
jgi:hypothetical protein